MQVHQARIPGRSPALLIGALAWVIAAGALLYRLPYGVSQRDEAFYSAIPYSFLLGNRPYFDELAMHQNAGLLLVPFYRLYVAIAGSADGIILFNRRLYFLYALVCSVLAYRLVKHLTESSVACWAAALVLTFSYFNLLSLSYNTCGAFGFFCGVLCSAKALLEPRPARALFGASLFFLSAVFSYPGLAAALLPYTVMVVACLYRKTPKATVLNGLAGLGAGFGVALLVMVPFLAWLGGAGLERLLTFSRNMGYLTHSAFERLNFFHSPAWSWRWQIAGFASVFVVMPVACLLLKKGLWLVAAVTALACGVCYWQSLASSVPSAAAIYLLAIPVLAPICVALNRDWQHGRFLLQLVWAPGIFSMIASAYSSNNGLYTATLGALAAVLAGVASLGALLHTLAERNPKSRLGYQLVFHAFVAALLFIQTHSLFEYIYDDQERARDTPAHAFKAHDTRVRSGPLRGVIATRADAQFSEAIDRDLKSLENEGHSLTIFDGFPTGYLSTRLRPKTFSLWIYWSMSPGYASELMDQTFGRPEDLPDLVLEIEVDHRARRLWKKYARRRYHSVVRRNEFGYVILQRNSAPRTLTQN